ncbi:MAG: HD domain-containing protein [Lachnospiraceae bacterium]|nr:HD domain-containing protein [Lachnospiraceae bacterium]
MRDAADRHSSEAAVFKDMFQSFMQAMSAAIDERTPYNATHTRNMVQYGACFLDYLNQKDDEAGRERRFSAKKKEQFLMSVWLHDIGKLVTPLGIMNKAVRLTGQETIRIWYRFRLMKLLLKIDHLEGRLDEAQLAEKLTQIEEAGQLIEMVNGVRYLDDELYEKVKELARQTYLDEDGVEKPWITSKEFDMLTIRRGTLTDEERKIMEQHVVMTKKLLSEIHFGREFEEVPRWAADHHEFLDGSGYPRQLRGDQIAYEVRIITILDIYDALTADDRPYKPGIPVPEALSILRDMAEKEGKLDIELTRAFIESGCWNCCSGG